MYTGDNPWEIASKGLEIISALPLGDVITLPATGSEMNCNSVISNKQTKEKFPIKSTLLFPVFSIIDPETTYSLPKRQIINGIVDTFIHTVEQYITQDLGTPLQDRKAEAILKTLIEETPAIMKEPADYNARANFFWCSTQALNGSISCGVVSDWSTHAIGHELTALYGLDHGETLAVIQPRVWENKRVEKGDMLVKYAKRVLDITEPDREKMISMAISQTENYFRSLGIKTKLSEYGIDSKEAAEIISKRFKTEESTLERMVILHLKI